MKKIQRLAALVLVLATLGVSFAGVGGVTKPTGNRVAPTVVSSK